MAPPARTGPFGSTHPAAPWPRDAVLAVVALVVLGGAGPAFAGARRLLRRHSRRRPDAAGLAVGAWLEMLDTFEAAGLRIAPAATSAEIMAAATARFGEADVDGMAGVADAAERALCSTGHPPGAAMATAAWAAQRAVRRRLLRALPRGRRLRASVTVGRQPRRPGAQVQPAVGRGGPSPALRAGTR